MIPPDRTPADAADRIPGPSDEQIAEWLRLAEATTPGEWRVVGRKSKRDPWLTIGLLTDSAYSVHLNANDAAFVAAAHTAVPALIAALSAARSARLAAEASRLLAPLCAEHGAGDWKRAGCPFCWAGRLMAARDAAEARAAQLAEALRPFALRGESMDKDTYGDELSMGYCRTLPTIGDCRRAADLLAGRRPESPP